MLNESIRDAEYSLEEIEYNSRLINDRRISTILPDLLKLQRHISKLCTEQFVSPQMVYHADIISTMDLQLLKLSCNKLFISSTYMLTTNNLISARTLSRYIANRGLNAVLFQIETTQSTKMFHLQKNNSLFFPFGNTFRICSIDQALDGVWYVKLIYTIDKDLQIVKEQLQYEVNQPLNWLTFRHFLRALKLIDEAKEYHSFWLRTLSIDHPDLISIHHHLGIFYAQIDEDSKALDHMNKVLQFTSPILSEVPHDDQYFGKAEECITSTVNQSIIFGNIADIYNKIGKHQMALEFYEKALVTTVDQRYRRQFQYKHRILTNKLNP